MKPQRVLILVLLAAGCGESVPGNANQGSTTPRYIRPEAEASLLGDTVTPVRIGELGPNFAACSARGTTRDRVGGGPVAVRAAPYDPANQIDALAPGAFFFLCSRSHDQRWFGIVYDQDGQASERCGVSAPSRERRDYPGPCAAGWVESNRVRLVSGVPDPRAPEEAVDATP